MKVRAYVFAASMVWMPRSRSSLTSRSCSVRCARSTRPLAGLLLAHHVSMLSSYIARPNCVTLLPVVAARVLRNTRAAEHARAVAVERDRLAVAFEIRARRLEVAEGRFARREMQRHQPAGRIVDIHQQRAGRRALLEPRMVTAVDLDQLAQTRAPGAWLVDLRRALPARNPQAGFSHQAPHGFLREPNTVALAQLLAGQRWTEVRVPFADDGQSTNGQTFVQLPVTGITPFV